MRIETTYKHVPLANGASFYFSLERDRFDTSFHKRRARRKGRHQANLDLKRSVCEALDDVDFANMQYFADSLYDPMDDYDPSHNDFGEYDEDIYPEPDYEAQAAKWERDNDDYMFRNRIGPYEGWREYDQEEWY